MSVETHSTAHISYIVFFLAKVPSADWKIRSVSPFTLGRSHWRGQWGEGGHDLLTPISETNKVQQFHFHTSEILFSTRAQKLYGPEISRYSPCMLQFLGNIRRLLIFSNYIEEDITSSWTF